MVGAGSCPFSVIMNGALFGFDEESRKMVLLEVAPGKSARQIQEKMDFKLNMAPNLRTMPEPTKKDLKLLREVCDYIRLEKKLKDLSEGKIHYGLRSATLGKVKWCKEINNGESLRYGTGIRYYENPY